MALRFSTAIKFTLVLSLIWHTTANADPGAEVYEKAKKQIAEVDKSLRALRERLRTDLEGRDYSDQSVPPYSQHTAQSLERWWFDAPQKKVQSAQGRLDKLRSEWLDGRANLSVRAKVAYRSVNEALVALWQLQLRAAGAIYDGEVQVLQAYLGKERSKLQQEYWDEQGNINRRFGNNSARGNAALQVLRADIAEREKGLYNRIETDYRVVRDRVRKWRRYIVGALWRWQSFADQRAYSLDDVHGKWSRKFEQTIVNHFEPKWYRGRNTSNSRLDDLIRGQFDSPGRIVLESVVGQPFVRRPGVEAGQHRTRVLRMSRAAEPSVYVLGETEPQIARVRVDGTELEQTIKTLHARLGQVDDYSQELDAVTGRLQGLEIRARKLGGLEHSLRTLHQDTVRIVRAARAYRTADAGLSATRQALAVARTDRQRADATLEAAVRDLHVRAVGAGSAATFEAADPETPGARKIARVRQRIAALLANAPDRSQLHVDYLRQRNRLNALLEETEKPLQTESTLR